MRVVNIQLDGPKEVLHPIVLDIAPVDEVLVLPPNDHLPGDGDLVEVLIAQGRLLLVPVVESDGDSGLGDASLAVLVDQFLEIGRPDVTQVSDAEEEADGVQNVTLPGSAHKQEQVK